MCPSPTAVEKGRKEPLLIWELSEYLVLWERTRKLQNRWHDKISMWNSTPMICSFFLGHRSPSKRTGQLTLAHQFPVQEPELWESGLQESKPGKYLRTSATEMPVLLRFPQLFQSCSYQPGCLAASFLHTSAIARSAFLPVNFVSFIECTCWSLTMFAADRGPPFSAPDPPRARAAQCRATRPAQRCHQNAATRHGAHSSSPARAPQACFLWESPGEFSKHSIWTSRGESDAKMKNVMAVTHSHRTHAEGADCGKTEMFPGKHWPSKRERLPSSPPLTPIPTAKP